MVVAVAVADAAAVDDHGVVEDRAVALADRLQLAEEVGELLDVELVDLRIFSCFFLSPPWCERSWWPSGTPMVG